MSSFLDSTGLTNLLGKIKTAFVAKADTTTATTISIDSTPTANSTNLVTSGGVKAAIPTKVSDLNNDSGFTANTGTITGITMNGSSKGTSGVVNLGTVLTAHQDISGKEDIISIVSNPANSLVVNTNTFYRWDQALNTLVVDLPNMTNVTRVCTVVMNFITGNSPSITIRSTWNYISYIEGYSIEPNKVYELNIIWSGFAWIVAYGLIDMNIVSPSS